MSELLPGSWMRAPLSDLCTINERAFSLLSASLESEVDFVPMAAVGEEFGGVVSRQSRPGAQVGKGYVSFVEGDVLFAKITPCMENGKLAVVPKLASGVGFGSTEFHVLRAAGSVEPRWLAYFLSQRVFRKTARQHMTGSAGQLRVSSTWLAAELLPVAPPHEQRRIVERLDTLLSDLDAAAAELHAAKRKLTLYRQSLLKSAVDGSLIGAEATDWKTSRVADVGRVQLGRQRAPQFHSGDNMRSYLRVANVYEDRIDTSDLMSMHFSDDEARNFQVEVGDILLNEGQSLELVGRPALVRQPMPGMCFTNSLVRFRASDALLPEFALIVFLHYMHSGRFRGIAKITTNIAHLGAGRFAALEMPLPPLPDQQAVVSSFSEHQAAIRDQRQAIDRALEMLAAQRQNILRAAFSGQLVPQDPNDEPASVLLERIRASRSQAGETAPGRGGRRKAAVP